MTTAVDDLGQRTRGNRPGPGDARVPWLPGQAPARAGIAIAAAPRLAAPIDA